MNVAHYCVLLLFNCVEIYCTIMSCLTVKVDRSYVVYLRKTFWWTTSVFLFSLNMPRAHLEQA